MTSVSIKQSRLAWTKVEVGLERTPRDVSDKSCRNSSASLGRVDPQGTFMRRLICLQRRKYSVAGPQSLWHMDLNHKL